MDAATLDVLVAWTFSSCGHGCCDTGCAGSMDVIMQAGHADTLHYGRAKGLEPRIPEGPSISCLYNSKTSKNPKRTPPAGVRQDAGTEG